MKIKRLAHIKVSESLKGTGPDFGRFFYLVPFGLLILLGSCRIGKQPITQKTGILPKPDSVLKIEKDTTAYFITQSGDSLTSLSEEILINLAKTQKDTISISAVGDIMMGTNFPNPGYLPPDGGGQLWQAVSPILKGSDISFGNLEGVILTDGGEQKECKNPKNCYLFRTPDALANHFRNVGFDLMSTANNHANDFGATGRLNTQRILDSLGIGHAGSIETPYTILRTKGYTVGFIAFSPNKGTISIHDLPQAISYVEMLDSLTDFVIVSFHAGAEGSKNQHINRKEEFYFGENRGNVYEFAHTMIDHGADVLLGHGPHVVRAMELYRDRIIAYSLGNFLTYGRFNLEGPNAYSPILEIKVDTEGKFLEGFIHSFIQDYELGPIPDTRQRALNSINDLSREDFPESYLNIGAGGEIVKKEK